MTKNVLKIVQIVESDRHASSVSTAPKTVSSQQFKKDGYTKRLDIWMPNELTRNNLMLRISNFAPLLNRNKIDQFLLRLIGDKSAETGLQVRINGCKGFAAYLIGLGIVHSELLPYS